MSKDKISSSVMLAAIIFAVFATAQLLTHQPTASAQGTKSSQKQKEHSKLYKEYEGGKKVSEILATEPGEIVLERAVYPPRSFGMPGSCATSSFLQKISCDADAVVVGTVNGGVSQLTAEEDFIFTDYEFVVGEVVKGNAKALINIGDRVTISRPGGELVLNGRQVRAIDQFFKPFEIGGEYVLFLKFIPTTGAYKAYRRGSFALTNNKVRNLTTEQLPDKAGSRGDATGFLTEIRATTSKACNSCGGTALY
jgi:hypothetical protein